MKTATTGGTPVMSVQGRNDRKGNPMHLLDLWPQGPHWIVWLLIYWALSLSPQEGTNMYWQ